MSSLFRMPKESGTGIASSSSTNPSKVWKVNGMGTSAGSIRTQDQILVQRPSTKNSAKQSVQQNNSSTAGLKQSKFREGRLRNGLSMAEVMADLRALQDQQKESQRKLANIKHAKEHRTQQRISLEKSLELTRCSNSEQRLQLSRVRKGLSATNRLLVAHRLEKDRSSDDIRAFDKLLKKGLFASRMNNEYRRKIETKIMFLTGKADAWVKLRAQIKLLPEMLQKEYDEAKFRANEVRQEVQKEGMKARKNLEQISWTRSLTSTLENHLSKAQQKEASRKLHAERLGNDIAVDHKHRIKRLGWIQEQIDSSKQAKTSREAYAVEAQASIEKAMKGIRELQRSWPRLQKAGKRTPVESDDEGMDLTEISSYFSQERNDLAAATAEKRRLFESVEAAQSKISNLFDVELKLLAQRTEIAKKADASIVSEVERRKALGWDLEQLATVAEELNGLQQCFSELTERRVKCRTQSEEKALALKSTLKEKQKEFSVYASQLIEKKAMATKSKQAWSKRKRIYQSKIDSFKRLVQEARKDLENLKPTSSAVEVSRTYTDMVSKKEMEATKAKKLELGIETLLHGYNELESVEFRYDPNATTDHQAQISLQILLQSCEVRIAAAKEEKAAMQCESRKLQEQHENLETIGRSKKCVGTERSGMRKRNTQGENKRDRKETDPSKMGESTTAQYRKGFWRSSAGKEGKSKAANEVTIEKRRLKPITYSKGKSGDTTLDSNDGSYTASPSRSDFGTQQIDFDSDLRVCQWNVGRNQASWRDSKRDVDVEDHDKERNPKFQGGNLDVASCQVDTASKAKSQTAEPRNIGDSNEKRVHWEARSDKPMDSSLMRCSSKKSGQGPHRFFATKSKWHPALTSSRECPPKRLGSTSENYGDVASFRKTGGNLDSTPSRKRKKPEEPSSHFLASENVKDRDKRLEDSTSHKRSRLSTSHKRSKLSTSHRRILTSSTSTRCPPSGSVLSNLSNGGLVGASAGNSSTPLKESSHDILRKKKKLHQSSKKSSLRNLRDYEQHYSSSKRISREEAPKSTSGKLSKRISREEAPKSKSGKLPKRTNEISSAGPPVSKPRRKKRKNDIINTSTAKLSSFGEDYDFNF